MNILPDGKCSKKNFFEFIQFSPYKIYIQIQLNFLTRIFKNTFFKPANSLF